MKHVSISEDGARRYAEALWAQNLTFPLSLLHALGLTAHPCVQCSKPRRNEHQRCIGCMRSRWEEDVVEKRDGESFPGCFSSTLSPPPALKDRQDVVAWIEQKVEGVVAEVFGGGPESPLLKTVRFSRLDPTSSAWTTPAVGIDDVRDIDFPSCCLQGVGAVVLFGAAPILASYLVLELSRAPPSLLSIAPASVNLVNGVFDLVTLWTLSRLYTSSQFWMLAGRVLEAASPCALTSEEARGQEGAGEAAPRAVLKVRLAQMRSKGRLLARLYARLRVTSALLLVLLVLSVPLLFFTVISFIDTTSWVDWFYLVSVCLQIPTGIANVLAILVAVDVSSIAIDFFRQQTQHALFLERWKEMRKALQDLASPLHLPLTLTAAKHAVSVIWAMVLVFWQGSTNTPLAIGLVLLLFCVLFLPARASDKATHLLEEAAPFLPNPDHSLLATLNLSSRAIGHYRVASIRLSVQLIVRLAGITITIVGFLSRFVANSP